MYQKDEFNIDNIEEKNKYLQEKIKEVSLNIIDELNIWFDQKTKVKSIILTDILEGNCCIASNIFLSNMRILESLAKFQKKQYIDIECSANDSLAGMTNLLNSLQKLENTDKELACTSYKYTVESSKFNGACLKLSLNLVEYNYYLIFSSIYILMSCLYLVITSNNYNQKKIVQDNIKNVISHLFNYAPIISHAKDLIELVKDLAKLACSVDRDIVVREYFEDIDKKISEFEKQKVMLNTLLKYNKKMISNINRIIAEFYEFNDI